MRRFLLIGLFATAALAQTIQFTDITSGPALAYVSVYGTGFGSTTGAVSIAGITAASQTWTPTKVTFQVPASIPMGVASIQIGLQAGTQNVIPFTVRAGNLRFVATSGSDANAGTLAAPWATIPHATNSISPGDIIYAENNVTATTPDPNAIGGYDNCVQINQNLSGTQAAPKALLAYPNATVTIGTDVANPACGHGALSLMNISGSASTPVTDWVIGGLTLLGGGSEAIGIQGWGPNGAQRIRIIGNNISATYANGEQGGASNFNATNTTWYGNNLHNVSTNLAAGSVTALQQGFYLGDESFSFDFEWNTIAYVNGCRGFQQNSSVSGDTSYSVIIANNIIHDTACDGIVYVNMDASRGTGVQIYNNVVYNTGQGPQPPDGGAFAGVYLQTWSVTGNGAATFKNNTLYNNGALGGAPEFLYYPESGVGTVNFGSNILDGTTPYMQILSSGSGSDITTTSSTVSGAANNFFGAGVPTAVKNLTGSTNLNPTFGNLTTFPVGNTALAGIGANLGGATPPPTVSITISPTSATLGQGGTQQFTATVTPSGTAVTWSASTGTISATGLYTAPASITSASTATITAIASGVSATATISLTPPTPVTVTISPSTATLSASQTQQFTATPSGATWSANIGAISSSGLYTAPASIPTASSALITATVSGVSASATVTLTPATTTYQTCPGKAVTTTQTFPAGPNGKPLVLTIVTTPSWQAVKCP
jgi:hypothetical protein